MADLTSVVLEDRNGTVLRLYIQPRASKSGWAGLHGDRLKVRVAAPPVDGEANEELVRFVAKYFGLPKSQVQLVRGETSRQKDVLCGGLAADEARRALASDSAIR